MQEQVVLSKRLQAIAEYIEENSVVADIGCDHAFLSIAIAQTKHPKVVYACDINEKPLMSARKNIAKHGVGDRVETVLSDGFDRLKTPQKIDTVVIAGMGGELIGDIIKRAHWIRDSAVTLLLQPMTMHEKLREFLSAEGFHITGETPVVEGEKIYTVIKAVYLPKEVKRGELFSLLGEIAPLKTPDAMAYKKAVAQRLRQKLDGLKRAREKRDTGELEALLLEVVRATGEQPIAGKHGN